MKKYRVEPVIYIFNEAFPSPTIEVKYVIQKRFLFIFLGNKNTENTE